MHANYRDPHRHRRLQRTDGQSRRLAPQPTHRVSVIIQPTVRRVRRGIRYEVRWTVVGRIVRRSFRSEAPAAAFHHSLKAALAQGHPFDIRSGLPLCMIPPDHAEPRESRTRRHQEDEG